MTDNDLFSKNEPRPWAPHVGVIGSSLDSAACETDAELAFAFRTAADVIAKHWQATGADDSLVLPILFNYRHALELGLKRWSTP